MSYEKHRKEVKSSLRISIPAFIGCKNVKMLRSKMDDFLIKVEDELKKKEAIRTTSIKWENNWRELTIQFFRYETKSEFNTRIKKLKTSIESKRKKLKALESEISAFEEMEESET